MEIIEISSPESSPKPSARPVSAAKTRQSKQPQRRTRRAEPVAHEDDIIELTDTDSDDGKDELVTALIRRSRSAMKITATQALATGSRAGPSTRPAKRPCIASRETPTKSRPSSPQPTASLPLFLPEDDGGEVPVMPPRTPTPIAAADPPLIIDISEEIEPVVETMDTRIARVLEIIPDVQPTHVLSLLEEHVDAHGDGLVEFVLHALFEDPGYPKIDKKGKRKRDEEDENTERRKSAKFDYGSKERVNAGGALYPEIALDQLLQDFPYIPKPHVRRVFFANNAMYAPTYLFIAEEQKLSRLPYIVKSIPSRVGKGKAKADPEFERERAWLLEHVQDVVAHDEQVAEELNEQEYEDCGDGIECGCCFSTYPFDKMIQCPDCHLFCISCMTSYASNLLGARDAAIVCMDQSGCKMAFPESELRRFLSPKLLVLYERVTQQKEIEAAGLEGLEECPFCEYKIIIENKEEKLFRCENVECGAVSCRSCKKQDHLPKSCKEVNDDKKLDARHVIEEAMTRALMRNCPKCQKAFVKEHGCNKMTCPNCHTLSCYICRKVITGYEHFNQAPGAAASTIKTGKCSLWDPVEQRHSDEVRKAARDAVDEYKRQHPDLTAEELKAIEVELPPAAPAAPAPAVPQAQVLPHAFGGVFPPFPGLDFGAGMLAQHQARQHQLQIAHNHMHMHMHMRAHAQAHQQDMHMALMNVGRMDIPPVPMHLPVARLRRARR